MSERESGPGVRPWQATFAALLLLIRGALTPASLLCRDWLLVVSAYWLYKSLRPAGEREALLLTSLAAFLLGIYLMGQGPLTLASWGFR